MEKYLTVRWNNWIALGVGIPVLVYVVIVLSASVSVGLAGFIGMAILGVLYWVVTEGHTAIRFAWLRQKNPASYDLAKRRFTHPLNLILVSYNVIWWIPIVLPFTKVIDYRTGFITFFIVTVIRLVANLLRNNILTLQQAENFPLRMGTRLRGMSHHVWCTPLCTRGVPDNAICP